MTKQWQLITQEVLWAPTYGRNILPSFNYLEVVDYVQSLMRPPQNSCATHLMAQEEIKHLKQLPW